jgi:drug/metabolite transporter (DMT)-like permease
MSTERTTPPPQSLLVAAFAALYIIWGSTYLGIKIAVETMPPWPMIAARHLTAGIILFSVLRLGGVPMPKREHLRGGVLGGVMLLVIGNGLVAYSAHRIPSGIASMVVALTPIWIVAVASIRPNGRAPSPKEWAGLLLGLAGLALLAGPGLLHAAANGAAPIDAGAVGLVLVGTISWAIGSVLGREMPKPENAFMGSALQMLCGGTLLSLACLVSGEWSKVDLPHISARSWSAFAFLVLCGSLLGFTAFVWLMRVAKTSHVVTYAYVNPIVALLLGASIGHERITRSMLLAGAVTLLGVVLVVMPSRAKPA